MHSIKTKTILLTVISIVATVTVATIIAAVAVRNIGNHSSMQILDLLCETGQKNLDHYFSSVEQSVSTVSNYAEDDLAKTETARLNKHLDRVKEVFEKTALHTSGILTYYYRIDPTVSDEKGFWFVKNANDDGFYEHEVTDISQYDTSDTTTLVWFTVPKNTGKTIWLPPYVTENLDEYVISFNVPIYKSGVFIGVIGIEIDYDTIGDSVDSITLYDDRGYAFINDNEGNIIYHPKIDVQEILTNHPTVPEGLIESSHYLSYTFRGVDRYAVWLPLTNGMRFNVTVPVSDVSAAWRNMVIIIVSVSAGLLLISTLLSMRLATNITKPLRKLTDAAEQVDAGNYDVQLDYKGDDEVGVLTHAFSRLIDNLKVYISDLNSAAYRDALTSLYNKSAYDVYTQEMQTKLEAHDPNTAFAIGVFDCDGLKTINDSYGHDKGDIYLVQASSLIARVFKHSPVFRTGGDEFTVIVFGEDYENLDALTKEFKKLCNETNALAACDWEKARVSMGIAKYDVKNDRSVVDTSRRADRLMYEDKRSRKKMAKR